MSRLPFKSSVMGKQGLAKAGPGKQVEILSDSPMPIIDTAANALD